MLLPIFTICTTHSWFRSYFDALMVSTYKFISKLSYVPRKIHRAKDQMAMALLVMECIVYHTFYLTTCENICGQCLPISMCFVNKLDNSKKDCSVKITGIGWGIRVSCCRTNLAAFQVLHKSVYLYTILVLWKSASPSNHIVYKLFYMFINPF